MNKDFWKLIEFPYEQSYAPVVRKIVLDLIMNKKLFFIKFKGNHVDQIHSEIYRLISIEADEVLINKQLICKYIIPRMLLLHAYIGRCDW